MANNVDSGTSRFFCDLGAMTPEKRTVYGALSRKLFGANEEKRELDNGYAYRLAAHKISISEIAEWITFERRCCPFFNLQIEVEPNDGPLVADHWSRGRQGIHQVRNRRLTDASF